MKLKSLELGPPGNWGYTQPETGVRMSAITFQSLLSKVAQHRHNNNLPITNMAEEVESAICAALSPANQVAYCVTGNRERSAVGFAEVVRFTEWLGSWLTTGHKLVPQDEANRRAAICATCPYNVGVKGCGVCQKSIGILRNKLMKVEPTSSNSAIKACGICGCDLKTIVHVPLDTLKHRGLEYKNIPWCWQNESNQANLANSSK